MYLNSSTMIAGLEVYTDYQVVVAAGTSVGYGPYSDPLVVKTWESGKFTIEILTVTSVNISFVF